MKKAFVFAISLMFVASMVFAADFSPTLLKLDAPSAIQYDFDGSALDITVTATGAPASAIFLLYTKDMAATMPTVVNGYLGWHTVNKMDTCIYHADPVNLVVGSNTVTWNGQDQDGADVPSGSYTYYLYGYDNVTAKVLASPMGAPQMGANVGWVFHDTYGNALARPVMCGNVAHTDTIGGGDAEGGLKRSKWTLGNDPEAVDLFETASYLGYMEQATFTPSPIEGEDDWWFQFTTDNNLLGHIRKWKWVPNGPCELDAEWGDAGEFVFSINTGAGWWCQLQEMHYAGGDLLAATNTDHSGVSTEAELVMVSVTDGEEVFRIDLSQWWVKLEDGEQGGQAASGPNKMDLVDDTYLFCGAHSSCMNNMLVPTAGEDEEDWNRWVNGNGDYTGDHNFEDDAENKWVCHDYNVGPYKYQIHADANLFSSFPTFDLGAVSFGLYGPDGTGLDEHAYSGETAGGKQFTNYVDEDTPYDGIYTDNVSVNGAWDGPAGHWFVGHDSVKGIIALEVGVDEDVTAFAVAQNAPNPFNPTTTISFTTVEAGNVSIDVFNVAGQKVDTIASEFMSPGSHSITWDATGFSAGVYFYTVKAGDFSKTMKMTLLK